MGVKDVRAHEMHFDAIIVPGTAFKPDSWGTLMRRRVIWSWILYKNGITRHIIYSGGAVYTPYTEAYVMGLYAEKLGVPKECILYDTLAQHSIENVYYSHQLARKHGFQRIAVCTDKYQTGFLKVVHNKRLPDSIHFLPVVKDTIAAYALDPLIDLEKARFHDIKAFRSIRERKNIFKRIQGTFGRNIPCH